MVDCSNCSDRFVSREYLIRNLLNLKEQYVNSFPPDGLDDLALGFVHGLDTAIHAIDIWGDNYGIKK